MNIDDNTQNGVWKLWSWLRGAASPIAPDTAEGRPCLPPWPGVDIARREAIGELRPGMAPLGRAAAGTTAVVLRFPLRGEALLVKLAELLRSRIAGRGPERDPLLLTISRCPGSRLSIDRRAYIAFDADRSAYQVAIEAAPDTTITLDTTDFDAVVDFVVQYIAERLSVPATLEAAS